MATNVRYGFSVLPAYYADGVAMSDAVVRGFIVQSLLNPGQSVFVSGNAAVYRVSVGPGEGAAVVVLHGPNHYYVYMTPTELEQLREQEDKHGGKEL